VPVRKHWGKVIGPYTDRARSTLSSQLDMLRALQDLGTPGVALVYRLWTNRDEESDEPGAVFDLRCMSQQTSGLTDAEALSFDDLSSVALLPGYSLWGSADRPPTYRHHTRLVPKIKTGDRLPIKADWSSHWRPALTRPARSSVPRPRNACCRTTRATRSC
jgi:hypothetical protein